MEQRPQQTAQPAKAIRSKLGISYRNGTAITPTENRRETNVSFTSPYAFTHQYPCLAKVGYLFKRIA